MLFVVAFVYAIASLFCLLGVGMVLGVGFGQIINHNVALAGVLLVVCSSPVLLTVDFFRFVVHNRALPMTLMLVEAVLFIESLEFLHSRGFMETPPLLITSLTAIALAVMLVARFMYIRFMTPEEPRHPR